MDSLLFTLDIISIFCLTYVATFMILERKRISKFLEELDEHDKE